MEKPAPRQRITSASQKPAKKPAKKIASISHADLLVGVTSAVIRAAKKRAQQSAGGERGYYGRYGGRYVPEVLRAPLLELEEAFFALERDGAFWKDFDATLCTYVARPTPLYYAENATRQLRESAKSKQRGARIYIKLEGFAHTGAHKINNALGQVLLAKRMGKTRIIAETGAGQHGLATATACAKLGLACRIYMGSVDMRRQRPNVHLMQMLGAEVVPAESGSKTLKDAINDAMRDWSANFASTHYVIGSALGPAPYPDMVQCFQSIIGAETALQCIDAGITPAALVACVGGGSNALGIFTPFLPELRQDMQHLIAGLKSWKKFPSLHAAEAGGRGDGAGQHASRLAAAAKASGSVREGIVQGYRSLFISDADGQLGDTYSISAGLDYPGVGPHIAHLARTGALSCSAVRDREALSALRFFARSEGLLFALESAHAGFAGMEIAKSLPQREAVVIHMSGRGDKDLFITAPENDKAAWVRFLRDELDRLS